MTDVIKSAASDNTTDVSLSVLWLEGKIICYFFGARYIKKNVRIHCILLPQIIIHAILGFTMHLKMQLLGNFANFEVREVGNVAACSFKYKSSSEVKEIKKQ